MTRNTSVRGNILAKPHLDVAGTGRQVDHEVVERAPPDILQEVLDGPVEHQPAPHDRIVLAGEESHRDDLEDTGSDGALDGDHLPPVRLQGALHPEQPRHRVAPDVGVEQADDQPTAGESDREVHTHRRLADSALAGHDREHPRRRGKIGRDGAVLRLEPSLRHQRRSLRRIHHAGADIDTLHAGKGLDLALDVGAELVAERAGGDREGDLDSHRSAVDLDAANHAQLDDVRAELGIDDSGQRCPDRL